MYCLWHNINALLGSGNRDLQKIPGINFSFRSNLFCYWWRWHASMIFRRQTRKMQNNPLGRLDINIIFSSINAGLGYFLSRHWSIACRMTFTFRRYTHNFIWHLSPENEIKLAFTSKLGIRFTTMTLLNFISWAPLWFPLIHRRYWLNLPDIIVIYVRIHWAFRDHYILIYWISDEYHYSSFRVWNTDN